MTNDVHKTFYPKWIYYHQENQQGEKKIFSILKTIDLSHEIWYFSPVSITLINYNTIYYSNKDVDILNDPNKQLNKSFTNNQSDNFIKLFI